MNERIRELAEQAGLLPKEIGPVVETRHMKNKQQDLEKFAELIVEEMYVFMCNATDNDKPWPSFNDVKKHFGVEE